MEGSGVGCGFCGVFDFADEDFDDVFEEEDSGGAAVVVEGSCDVGAGSPHGGEGVFEVGLVVDGGQAPDAFGGDGLVGGVGAGEVHDVFEVEVTGGLSGGVVDAVAGVASGHDGALQVVGVASAARVTTSAIGTSTSETFLVVNSNAAARAPVVSSMSPSRVDCSTMPATSSRV